ncbi:hypothetical protein C8R41DRAFT_371325 [Lentinula lateritia]|uniref:Uncharacterized protein n=1 Tax=Lentinula lateritia TaxID=40482 RepID=A0ABQ8VHY6_9AGAR|nr:hypothetical protein C8R41DRAFT_371325 [Lentinula lateritia]
MICGQAILMILTHIVPFHPSATGCSNFLSNSLYALYQPLHREEIRRLRSPMTFDHLGSTNTQEELRIYQYLVRKFYTSILASDTSLKV